MLLTYSHDSFLELWHTFPNVTQIQDWREKELSFLFICLSSEVSFLFQINLNFKSVNVEGAELHNMGQQTDIGNVY